MKFCIKYRRTKRGSCLFAWNKVLGKTKGNFKAWEMPVWTWYDDIIINSMTLILMSNSMGVTVDGWWRQDDLIVLYTSQDILSTIFMTKKHIWNNLLVPKISIYFIWICLSFFLMFHSILIPQVPKHAASVLIIYISIYMIKIYIYFLIFN